MIVIILQTSPGKGGAYLYDIHFWLGKDTSQVYFILLFNYLCFFSDCFSFFCCGCNRMNLEQQPLKLLNLMQFLVGVLYSTENSKVMSLTSFYLTSSHVLFHWRVALHQGLRNLRRKSLKRGCMFVKGNELSDWSRYGPFRHELLSSLSASFRK